MSESEKRELIRRYLRAYKAFDLEGMLATLSPDVRFENHSGAEMTHATDGIQEFRVLAEKSMSLFEEREQRVIQLRVLEGIAEADIEFHAKLAVDGADGQHDGAGLVIQGRSTFSFKGGRISGIVDRS